MSGGMTLPAVLFRRRLKKPWFSRTTNCRLGQWPSAPDNTLKINALPGGCFFGSSLAHGADEVFAALCPAVTTSVIRMEPGSFAVSRLACDASGGTRQLRQTDLDQPVQGLHDGCGILRLEQLEQRADS